MSKKYLNIRINILKFSQKKYFILATENYFILGIELVIKNISF